MTIGAKVSTSRVKLRVGISVVDAHAEVSYVLPVAAISYIDMKLTASLDVLNKNPYVSETQVVIDDVVFDIAKKLSDIVTTAENVSFGYQAAKTDSVAVTDLVQTVLTYIRVFGDSFGLTDAEVINFIKNLKDQISTADIDTYAFSKFIPDGVAMQDGADVQDGNAHIFEKYVMNMAFPTDANQKFFEKLLLDTFSGLDALSVSFSRPVSDFFNLLDETVLEPALGKFDVVNTTDLQIFDIDKSLFDAFTQVDALELEFSKLLADDFSQTDFVSFSTAKLLQDNFAFMDTQAFFFDILKTDSAIVTESLANAFNKQISPDSIAFSDQIVKNPGKGLSDSAAPDDTGWLYAQNYCDITYFLEDYVGEYRTFT